MENQNKTNPPSRIVDKVDFCLKNISVRFEKPEAITWAKNGLFFPLLAGPVQDQGTLAQSGA